MEEEFIINIEKNKTNFIKNLEIKVSEGEPLEGIILANNEYNKAVKAFTKHMIPLIESMEKLNASREKMAEVVAFQHTNHKEGKKILDLFYAFNGD